MIDNLFKSFRVFDSEMSQNFSIQADVGLLEQVDKLGVSQPRLMNRCINSGNPETP
jgi:hypothetical protein